VPISREEFRQRRIDLSLPIADLLAANAELAFTVDEIRRLLVETIGRNESLDEVEHALEALVSQGRAEKAEVAKGNEINGGYWYAIVIRRLGFLKE
jgi:hypothetical protein